MRRRQAPGAASGCVAPGASLAATLGALAALLAASLCGGQQHGAPTKADMVPINPDWATQCYAVKESSAKYIRAPVVCAPSLVVAGMGKAGTSALYEMLLMHRDVAAPGKKEFCPPDPASPYFNHLYYLQYFPIVESPKTVLVSGCIYGDINGGDIMMDGTYIMSALKDLPLPKTKYIFLVRNYADFIYAAYTFWCRPGFDARCENTIQWVENGKHYRSADLFHELVKASDVDGAPLINHPWTRWIRRNAAIFRPSIERAWRAVGPENVVIIKSERLREDPRAVLQTLARLVGLDPGGFDARAYERVLVNVHNFPGQVRVSPEAALASTYNGGNLRPDTRALLDAFWADERKWMRDTFGMTWE